MPELPMLSPAGGPRIPALEKPPEPQAGAHIAEAGQRGIGAADTLFWMQRQARRDEEVGVIDSKLGQYALAEADMHKRLADVTDPDEFLQLHQVESKALRDGLLADIPPGAMRDHLSGALDQAYAHSMVQATDQSLALQIKAGQDSIKAASNIWVRVAATTDDPTTEADAIVKIHKAWEGNKFLSPAEQQAGVEESLGKVDLGRLQHRVDTNDPHVLMELHDPDFAAKHPLITPQEHEALKNLGVAQMTSGYRMVEAQTKAEIGANEMRLDAVAAQGQNISGELEHLAAYGKVSPEFYRAHTGHPYAQTMPGVAEAFMADINAAKSQADLDGVTQRAYIASEMGQLAGKDMAAVGHAAAIARTHLNDAAKLNKDRGEVEINDTLFKPGDPFMRQFEKKPNREAVMKYYEMRIGDHKGDVDQAVKDTLEKYKDYTKDGSSGAAIGRLLNAGPKP